jgi:Tol biopolymer transport system component
MNTYPQLAQEDWLETWPAWSPDGEYLYFCRAKKLWTDMKKVPPDRYREVKYDLARISYDEASDRWGEVETVLPAEETGLSIGQPRVSPDGRWLSFVMFPYSCWPVYHPECDAYLIDLQAAKETGEYEYRRMEASSNQCDSWVSWSSNSRWVVIGSARGNILFNRPYLAYVDADGKTSKPFPPPQQDPDFYAGCLDAFTMPELLMEPVRVTRRELAAALRSAKAIPVDGPAGQRQQRDAYERE